MSRQPAKAETKNENVTILSNAPVDQVPDAPGLTAAAADAAPREPQIVGEALALSTAKEVEDVPEVKYYRALNDKRISSVTGFRAKIYAGKELCSKDYNIRDLMRQGVKLEEIDAP